MNPAEKRLAMMVEDHPMEYNSFEGVIPEGHYGAGPVMIWDNGTYEVDGSLPPQQQIERGEFKFVLHGQKLRGGFVLVRTSGKKWLLIKHRDDFVDRKWNIAVPSLDHSVATGRTLDEILAGKAGKPRRAGNPR
jgi:bifunctional non-homologous end joining protein LigD